MKRRAYSRSECCVQENTCEWVSDSKYFFFYVLTYHQEHQKTLKLVCKEELTFLILLQIIYPVENDVILEDVPERTATANNSVEEEVVDDQEDDQSGKSVN